MSLRGNRIVGIPVVLMHEGEGLVVTVETKSGYLFRGTVETAEDNMNMSMKEVDVTDPRGTKSTLRKLFLRGSQVVMVIYPPLLSHAPVFKRAALAAQGVMVAGGLGRGRQAAIMSKSESIRADARVRGCRCRWQAARPALHAVPRLLQMRLWALQGDPAALRPRWAAPRRAARRCTPLPVRPCTRTRARLQ